VRLWPRFASAGESPAGGAKPLVGWRSSSERSRKHRSIRSAGGCLGRCDLGIERFDGNLLRCFGPERALSSPNACTPARFKSTENLRRHTSRQGPDLHSRRHQAYLGLGA
jgi:hypothetical protein